MLHAELLGLPVLTSGTDPVRPPSRRALALVAYLVVCRAPVPRAELATLLWGEGKQGAVRQALYVLRKLPGADRWLDGGDPVSVRGRSDLDALRRHAAEGDADGVAALLRGPFLAGLDDVGEPPFRDWVDATRAAVHAMRLGAVLQQARRHLASDDPDAAWSVLAPELAAGQRDDPLVRGAVEVQLARGQHDAARALLEQAAPQAGGSAAWDELAARLQRHPATQRQAEWVDLPAEAHRLARSLALSAVPLPPRVHAAATDLDDHAAAGAWEALADVGWLDGGALRGDVREWVEARLGGGGAALHARLATALRAEGAAATTIARHEALAGDVRAAVHRLLAAGRREHLELARELAVDPVDRLDVLRAGVARLHDEMRHDEVDDWLEALEAAARAAQDGPGLFQASLQRAYQLSLKGRLDDAQAALDDALDPGGEPHAAAMRAAATGVLALRAGRIADAVQAVAPALATAWPRRAEALNILAVAQHQLGHLDEARATYREAIAASRASGRVAGALRALNGLAIVEVARSQPAAAVDLFQQALDAAEAAGLDGIRPALWVNLARLELVTGRLGDARGRILALTGASDPELRCQVWMARGTLEAECGRYAEAAVWFARAERGWADAPRTALRLAFRRCRADWLASGDPAALEAMRGPVDALRAGPGGAPSEVLLLAMAVPDPAEAEALIGSARVKPGHARLIGTAQLRVAILRGRAPEGPAPEVVEFCDVFGLALWVAAHADPAARARLDETVERCAEGLLTSQREALRHRVQRWIDDPVAARGP